MGINVWELLLWAVMGWIGIGTAGLVTSWVRLRRGVPEERARIVRGFKWLLAVAVAYVALVVGVSIVQPGRIVGPGQARCFGTMCYSVTGVEELPRFLGKNQAPDGSRLLRVIVTVKNNGSSRSEDAIRAYLVDAQARRWEQSKGQRAGLSNRLRRNRARAGPDTRPLAAGGSGDRRLGQPLAPEDCSGTRTVDLISQSTKSPGSGFTESVRSYG